MKKILLLILFVPLLFSQELLLDSLLNEYQDSESLYKKTKKESAGFLLVYSREDLERMQAYSLKDVLKTIRLYTLQMHSIGVSRILNVGQGKSALPPIKLYIDDFEITSVAQGNALDMYGEMDIYFVDHIEIYQGGNSIAFGNSPGSMVIRLYSKDPSRENSSSTQITFDSKSSGDFRIIDAGSADEYDYLFYADAAKTNYKKPTRNKQELSRDASRLQAHFKISQDDNFEIAIDTISTKTDIFNGMGTAPLGDDSLRRYTYINAIKYFQGDIKLSLAASTERKKFFNSDANGIQLTTDLQGTPTGNDLDIDIHSNTYKITLDKKIIDGNHDFLIGAEFQQNRLKVKTYKGTNVTPVIGPKKLDIYMFYLEELYNINKNNLLAFSAKVDYYKDSFSKSSTEYAYRLGYISLINEVWTTKLFAISRYTYPNALQTTFAPPVYNVNPELESSTTKMLAGELEYNDNTHRVVFGYAYKVIDDALSFDKVTKKYINSPDTIYFNRVYIRGEHHFNFNNKAIIEVYKGYKDDYYSPGAGALVQLFNKVGKFDIYNELVYRDSYILVNPLTNEDIKMDAGYDYTLAISYPVNKKLKVKLKGENLLNKASKTIIDTAGEIKIPAIERRGLITMEYTF
ncbi:MAG: TonB-dependent receptor [Sulfurimonas sp.]|nr:TonB-dependent receptor [Sulfurimonas sp.]